MSNFFILVVSFNIFSSLSYAGGPGSTASNFLKIPISARATAVGLAFTALADDNSAIYYNPSGLAQLKNSELLFSYNRYIQDISQSWLGFSFPMSNFSSKSSGVLGFGLNYLSVSPFSAYDDTDKPIGNVSAQDVALYGSYSNAFKTDSRYIKDFYWGGTIKYISESLDKERANAFAFDLGLITELKFVENLKFGIMAENIISSKVKFIDESYKLPFNLRLGSSYKIVGSPVKTTFSVDYNFSSDASNHFRVGIESEFSDLLLLRFGYNSFGDISQGISLGFGINAIKYLNHDIRFNYSFSSTYDFGSIHKIDLVYKFKIRGENTLNKKEEKINEKKETKKEAKEKIEISVSTKTFDYEKILKSENLEEKIKAIEELGEIRSEESFKFLLSLLEGKKPDDPQDMKILLAIIDSLFKYEDRRVVKPFIKLLNMKNVNVRRLIISKIGRFVNEDKNVFRALILALKDRSALVRREAVRVLGECCALKAEDELRQLLEVEKDKEVIEEVKKSLGTIDWLRKISNEGRI